jgi:predicted nucleic acid-binding protein
MNKLLIYLDNCCYNRPYDDLSSITVYLEAEAKLTIQDLVKNNNIDLVWSYILEFENSANPSIERKASILVWKEIAKINVLECNSILSNAKEFFSLGLGVKDSIHIACAIEANCDYFITTDKGIIKKAKTIDNIKILNPINFIQFIEDANEN